MDGVFAPFPSVAVDALEVSLVDPLAAFDAKRLGDELRPEVGGQGEPSDGFGRFLH